VRVLPTLLLFWASLAFGWEADLQLPPPAPVVDEAGLLSGGEASSLSSLLVELKARSGVEVSVYIASSLRERPIEDFSMAVAERWALGEKKVDRGLIFLIAPKERQMRFEVGTGLQGDLTDVYSRRILDNVVKPLFLDGRYAEGIRAGLASVSELVPLGIRPDEAPNLRRRGPTPFSNGAKVVIVLLVIFFLIIRAIFRPLSSHRSWGRRGGGGWGGYGGGGWGGGFGSGGGSSWGGGGGGFSGGGASSSW
jgi:uncharacterized protein